VQLIADKFKILYFESEIIKLVSLFAITLSAIRYINLFITIFAETNV
jgi:hypothetical protein